MKGGSSLDALSGWKLRSLHSLPEKEGGIWDRSVEGRDIWSFGALGGNGEGRKEVYFSREGTDMLKPYRSECLTLTLTLYGLGLLMLLDNAGSIGSLVLLD